MTKPRFLLRLLRWLGSTAIVAVIVYACASVPGIEPVTVGMLLLLAVLVIAARWGTSEAAVASIAGGLLFDYFILPPPGLDLNRPQHWVAFGTFLATSFVVGRYSIRLAQRARDAAERRAELERLYSLAEVMLMSSSFQSAVLSVVQQSPDIFQAGTAVFYDAARDAFVCSKEGTHTGLEDWMRGVASGLDPAPEQQAPEHCVIPVRFGGRVMGAFALCGANLSKSMATYVGHTLAIGLERARALEEAARTEAARESEELRATMLDALAHDLKTPLTSIKAAVTSLLSLPGPGGNELLDIIDEETDRLNRLSSQAIELERVGIGMLHAQKKPQHLGAVIQETIEEMQGVLKGRNVQVVCPEDLPQAEFDVRLIKEVLHQLLDNARKYSPAGSPIRVECDSSHNSVVVEVVDRGPGVAQDARERIFEKFQRGTQSSVGVGLGLTIARQIVRAHDGDIWVQNQPDRGTVFHFSLPSCRTAYTRQIRDSQS